MWNLVSTTSFVQRTKNIHIDNIPLASSFETKAIPLVPVHSAEKVLVAFSSRSVGNVGAHQSKQLGILSFAKAKKFGCSNYTNKIWKT